MFIGSGALWGETILFSMCILEEMQWKRTRYITSADFFHGTLELVEPGVPVFLFMGEDENRKLDERVRAFLTRGVTGDTDINIIDTAEFAIPGLDDEFRVIVSPWILSSLITDRLAAYWLATTRRSPSTTSSIVATITSSTTKETGAGTRRAIERNTE